MDMDINNTNMLEAGAYFRQTMDQQQDWHPIGTAPKDGTVIEVRCTYGVAPWYGLFIWKEIVVLHDNNGESHEMRSPGWKRVGDDSSSFEEGSSFTWRPYRGMTISYIDPTGGAQDSPAYWRGAAAASHGLPVDVFEKSTQLNVDDQKRGFLWRLLRWFEW